MFKNISVRSYDCAGKYVFIGNCEKYYISLRGKYDLCFFVFKKKIGTNRIK